ncbi:MAG: hypothetical protein ACTHMU_23255 [Thermomicrobiales bacterium]
MTTEPAPGAREILTAFPDILNHAQARPGWDSPADRERWHTLFRQAPALAQTNPGDLVTLLIAALGAPDRAIFLPAAYILHALTGEDRGFHPFGTPAARHAAQADWAAWWRGAAAAFVPRLDALGEATLIVDEIPGRRIGNDDEPPGRLLLLDRAGVVAWETDRLKMPYDAAQLADGGYAVAIIRARAVWWVRPDATIGRRQPVGGYPCSLELLPNGHLLVAGWDDDVPGFVREFDQAGAVVWRLEPLHWPWKAHRLANGHTLIADAGTGRVFEVDRAGREVWAVDGLGPATPALFDALGPVYCQRLYDGNTLVSIRALSRIVELDPAGQVVWEVGHDIVADQYAAVRLWNGNTLVADAGHGRVIELDSERRIVWGRRGFGYPAKAYRCHLPGGSVEQ